MNAYLGKLPQVGIAAAGPRVRQYRDVDLRYDHWKPVLPQEFNGPFIHPVAVNRHVSTVETF